VFWARRKERALLETELRELAVEAGGFMPADLGTLLATAGS
jgi:hypothetical protein